METRWKLVPTDQSIVSELQQTLKIHEVFCQLLAQRGISTFEEAKRFFRPELSQLHDPFLMKDAEKAVERLEKAIINKERILLYGDYDVDGTTSVALMFDFLSTFHDKLDYYIPDRYKEGYGISMEGIDYAKQNGISLVIAMDCGIKATKEVSYANESNIDFIICDHHLPGEELPPANAILNPKQKDCEYPFKELSGCGVAFKLVQAYCQKNSLPDLHWQNLLEFVAISIACDIVPMIGENRVLTHYGLKQLNRSSRPGLKALIHESRRSKPLSISDIVFGLGPMINAAGRLSDAKYAVKLLLSANKYIAYENAHYLNQKNKLRKEYDQLIAEEAKKMFREQVDWQSLRSVVLYQPHWHKGVIGIAASRLVEKYHRPSIILTESNDKIVGSARSIKGFNIYKALQSCDEFLENYGGHDHAAGLTLKEKNLEAFKEKFEEICRSQLDESVPVAEIPISAPLNFDEIDLPFYNILKQFAPFGPGNRNPIFGTKHVQDIGYSKVLKGNHLRLAVKQENTKPLYGIAFGRGDDIVKIKSGLPFHLCYKLELNHWKGKDHLQLMIRDIKF